MEDIEEATKGSEMSSKNPPIFNKGFSVLEQALKTHRLGAEAQHIAIMAHKESLKILRASVEVHKKEVDGQEAEGQKLGVRQAALDYLETSSQARLEHLVSQQKALMVQRDAIRVPCKAVEGDYGGTGREE